MWQNVHIQTHTSGAGVLSERVTTLKTTDLLSTRTNKCMHGSFLLFLNEKGMGQPFSVFSCLCLTDQQHEFTWTQTKEAETWKNNLLSNQIFMFHQNQNSPSDSSETVQSDLSGTVTVMNTGVSKCVCVFGKLLSLYSWVTGKCVFSSLYIKSNHSIRFTASLPESVRVYS